MAWRALADGGGNGTILSARPAWHDGTHLGAVITGATMVCFSFIGFDAITMYTEEAKDASTVPKAIVLTLLIGGAIFFVAAWFTQSLFPSVEDFSADSLENSALPEIAYLVGGNAFKILLTAAAFAATAASGLASHASVSRLLFVMARDGSGPISRLLSYVHPSFRTPAYAVVFVGIVSLGAIPFDLDFIAALINFGAVLAFSFVNLTVIAWFVFHRRERNTPKQIALNLLLPLIGLAFTLVLWLKLSPESRNYGLIWFGAGVLVLLALTRFLRRPLTINMGEDEDALAGQP
ncbi:APC family permease [Actinomycetota bacterium]